jgi:teichuronic acid biosynthesis glycosyltransferase TuaC
MACGSPVVATRVGGIPEIVQAPEAGLLTEQRTPEAVATSVRALLARTPHRAATRLYAERYDWGETTRGQLALFRHVAGRAASERS